MDTVNEVVLVHIVGELPPSKVAANRKQPSYGFVFSCIFHRLHRGNTWLHSREFYTTDEGVLPCKNLIQSHWFF